MREGASPRVGRIKEKDRRSVVRVISLTQRVRTLSARIREENKREDMERRKKKLSLYCLGSSSLRFFFLIKQRTNYFTNSVVFFHSHTRIAFITCYPNGQATVLTRVSFRVRVFGTITDKIAKDIFFVGKQVIFF